MGQAQGILTAREEEILRSVHFYRYVTAQDVAALFFSPRSISHVREILSRLAGGADYLPNQYLYRFPYFDAEGGGALRVYTLGSRGREFLAKVLGLPVDWYFRPDKVRHLSYNQVLHNLLLTRVLVSAKLWCGTEEEFELTDVRSCYELLRGEGAREQDREPLRLLRLAVPDAWLKFERLVPGVGNRSYPVLLEIDRGRGYKQRFQEHVRSRIEFVRSGAYRQIFGLDAVRIAYLTSAPSGRQREQRREAMRTWTMEVLKAAGLERWAKVFRFLDISAEEVYTAPVFEWKAAWLRPDSREPDHLFSPRVLDRSI